jgi:hypothetical protein
MGRRACASGISLSENDAAIVKGMLIRGDRQHDIAAWFGVNAGRIAEIATGCRFEKIEPASFDELPPSGPYPAARVAVAAISALSAAKVALSNAEKLMKQAA